MTISNELRAAEHLASFEVLGTVQDHGPNEKTGKQRYWIKVKFDGNNVAAFHCESKSLRNCFEMIETFGQQVKGMNSEQFNRYMNTADGKRIFFDITRNKETGEDDLTAYKYNSVGTALKYAFDGSTKHPERLFEPRKRLKRELVADLKNYAISEKSRIDTRRNNRRLRIDVRRNDIV